MTSGSNVPKVPVTGAQEGPRPEIHASPIRVGPEAVIERWHRVLAMLADNDNARATGRGRIMAAVLALPVFVMTALVGCIRFLS